MHGHAIRISRRRTSGSVSGIRSRLFWGPSPLGRLRGRANDGQECQCKHRQGDVPIPAIPRAYFVFIQSRLLLGRFEADLDGPALTGGNCQIACIHFLRPSAQVISLLLRLNMSPDQEPPNPSLLRRKATLHRRPVVQARPLGAILAPFEHPCRSSLLLSHPWRHNRLIGRLN